MTYPIQPGSSFRAAQIGESRQTFSLPQNFFVQDRHNDCPLSRIAAAAPPPPPWGKSSDLWTPYIYSLRPMVPRWIWIRWIQYATYRNNFKSLPALAMSTPTKIPLRQPATSSLCNIFWRKFTLLSFNNALTKRCTYSLRHLAAKMPSQLYNNFIYFLPSFLPTSLAAYQRKPFISCYH